MKRKKQHYFQGFDKLGIKEFGGSLLKKGNPREARPISIKKPIHLVLKSSLATGELSFLRTCRVDRIEKLVSRIGKIQGVKVYRYANSGNHLHLVVLPRSKVAFRSFLRAIAGLIARVTLGAERGKAKGIKFWDARPFTRIIEWGKEFDIVSRYVQQNILEAIGFIATNSKALSGA